MKSIPLFPDLLDQVDPYHRNDDFVERGFGIWSLRAGNDRRSRGEGVSDSRAIVVVYDDERFDKVKTGLHWVVEIRRYRYFTETQTTGWGSTRRTKSQLRMRYKAIEKRFATRDDAVDFAQRMIEVVERVKHNRERSEYS
jgi:hypothetical protein